VRVSSAGAFSIIARYQLMCPGNHFIEDHQLYNVIVNRARADHGSFS